MAWLVQLVRSLPSATDSPVRSPALPRFQYLCSLLSCLSYLSFPSFQDRQINIRICWELTCDGLVSLPEEANPTETGPVFNNFKPLIIWNKIIFFLWFGRCFDMRPEMFFSFKQVWNLNFLCRTLWSSCFRFDFLKQNSTLCQIY